MPNEDPVPKQNISSGDESQNYQAGRDVNILHQPIEKWKAVQRAIGLTERAGTFLGRVIGPSAEALGGLLGDQLKSWRAANLDRIARKWEKIRFERGIADQAIRSLPFGDAYRAIEAASVEEDTNVQELWAQLIANATDPSQSINIKKAYIDILKSLGSPDAIVLDLFFDHATSVPIMAFDEKHKADVRAFYRRLKRRAGSISSANVFSAVDNLVRLRIIGLVVSYPRVFGEMAGDITIHDYVRRLRKQQTADALIELVDTLNQISGWSGDEAAEDMNSEQALNHALSKYSLTPLGFDLLSACESP